MSLFEVDFSLRGTLLVDGDSPDDVKEWTECLPPEELVRILMKGREGVEVHRNVWVDKVISHDGHCSDISSGKKGGRK